MPDYCRAPKYTIHYGYMDTLVTQSLLFGALGGLIRALVGVGKYFEKNKKEQKIRVGYLVYTVLLAALIGGIGGVIANGDWKLALIVGYAGTDFLEGLYKIKKAQGFEI